MNFLRALLQLPLLLGRALLWLTDRLIGPIRWSPPAWLAAIGRLLGRGGTWLAQRPAQTGIVAVVLAVAAGGGWYGWKWWQAQPRPKEPTLISFKFTAPAVTNYEYDPITINPLTVEFSGSIAPLEKADKTVTEGITVDPPVAGSWTWVGDAQLRFTPAEDWPVGQHYRVDFDVAKAFAQHVRVSEKKFEFDTAPFTASVGNREFYQDPEDARQKKAIVQIDFDYPVDAADFEKRIDLTWTELKQKTEKRKFAVTYDRKKLHAYIHSEPLPVPKDGASVVVSIDKGAKSLRGGPATPAAVTASVDIPGQFSLRMNEVQATLVDNERFEPEQVLLVDASEAVNEKDVQTAVTAFVLPVYHPNTKEADRTEPYAWSTSEVTDKILKVSDRLDLAPIATERDYEPLHSFKHHAAPGRYVFVKVAKGLKSFGGYVLGDNQLYVVQVPQYPRILKFVGDGALLSMSGDKRVSVVSRNVPGLKLEIARVLPDQIQHLVTMNYGTYKQPALSGLSKDNITERFEKKVAIEVGDPAAAHYEGIDLSPYLGSGSGGRRGVFLVQLTGHDPAKKEAVDTSNDSDEPSPPSEYEGEGEGDYGGDGSELSALNDQRLIVVTDLGVVVKKSLDGSYDLFVQSIANGNPVGDAKIEILGKNGQTLVSQATGSDGRAHFAALEGFKRERQPSLFVVKKGEDLSFLPFAPRDRALDTSRFDVGGIRNAKDAGQLSGYLFSDRGIYRPGETFHVGMIVRAADWSRNLVGVPLQAEVLDPRGMLVDRRKLKLSATGFEELSYTTQESSPTGNWSVNLYIVKDDQLDQQIGTVSVQVKEFEPDRMKATAHLSREVAEGWVKPTDLSARVALANLFGTPATDRRVEAKLTLQPSFPAFPSWPAFRFYDPTHAKDGYSEQLGDRKTDEHGETVFDLDLSKYGTASYRLHFLAKGYEADSGRSVAAEVAALVSPLDYLVGVKTDGNLDFVKRDDERHVQLIAIDPNAKKTKVGELTAAIVERRYVSILTKQDSGVYKYESRLKEIAVSDAPLTIGADGLDYTLPTGTPGNYALVIRNARGEALNKVEYSVAGEANVSRSLERNAELQMVLSKKDYAPGEDIEIAVRAPYAGSGLITIERDHVYAHAWFHAATTSTVQKIKVPADFEGNGYISVQYLRDPSSSEIFMSPLSYGVVPFSVNRDARRDALTVDSPNLVKPGDRLDLKVSTGTPARVAVFAVDEGILQVARYKLGDPLDHFFQKRMLEVSTAQILDLVLPEFAKLAAMAAPGGDADGLLGRNLNPFRKKHAPPVAYWSGLVDVKDSTTLSWKVPEEFNGRLRVMAVAVAKDRIGVFTGGTTVRGDFVLSPNVPNFVAPGDEFDVSVGVANNLTGLGGKPSAISVKLDAGKMFDVVGGAEQSLTLAELREGVAHFRLKAKGEPGSATLLVTASSGDKSARQHAELSVRPAQPYRVEVAVGSMAKGQAEVGPLRSMYDPFAKRSAAASFTPLVLGRGLASYLEDFPHLCTEQLLSRAMPALVFERHPEFGKLSGDGQGRDGFAGLMTTLRSRQNGEGGFGLWTATPTSERFVSAYAVLYLLEAKERGKPVPADLLSSATSYLAQLAADESDGSLAGLRERAFAIYLLTRQGLVTTNQLASVRQRLDTLYAKEWKSDATAAWVAATLKLLKEDKEANALIAGPTKVLSRDAAEAAYIYDRYYDPLVRDADTLYLLSRHFPEQAKALNSNALINLIRPIQKGWMNTLSSSMTILALETYANGVASLDHGELTLFEVAANAETAFGKADGLVVGGAFSGKATHVRVRNAADLPAWYTVTQGGYDRASPSAVRKDGIEVAHTYTDAGGKPVDRVALGQEVDVHVRIRATRGDGVGSLAIIDLLPGGFEPVLAAPPAPPSDGTDGSGGDSTPPPAAPSWVSRIGLASSTWTPEYADIRDDRVVIYGYASSDIKEFVYRIRATNSGDFTVAPAYGESMYDRSVMAQSLGGKISVEPAAPIK